jgi:hypothetical protein
MYCDAAPACLRSDASLDFSQQVGAGGGLAGGTWAGRAGVPPAGCRWLRPTSGARKPVQLIDQHPQRAPLLALRGSVIVGRDAEQRCDQRHRLVQPVGAARQESLKLVELVLR